MYECLPVGRGVHVLYGICISVDTVVAKGGAEIRSSSTWAHVEVSINIRLYVADV